MRPPFHFLLATILLACGVSIPMKVVLEGHRLSAAMATAEAKSGKGNGGGNGNGNGGGNGNGRGSGNDGGTGSGSGDAGSDGNEKGDGNGKANAASNAASNMGVVADSTVAESTPAVPSMRALLDSYMRVRPGVRSRLAARRAGIPGQPVARSATLPARSVARTAERQAQHSRGLSSQARAATASTRKSDERAAPAGIVASGLTPSDIRRLSARGLAVDGAARLAGSNVVRFRLPAGMSVRSARRAIAATNAKAVSDADAYYYTDGGPTDCTGSSCAATQIQWSGEVCGVPPVIGMIDTRVDTRHEALAGQQVEVIQLAGSTPASNADHGTAIAALLGGRRDSDAPGLLPAKIVAVDAFAIEDGVERADVPRLVDALEALARRGVRVVNLSFSGPPNAVLKEAIDRALARGMILVAAAGNGGPGAEPAYPAAYPGVIAVTAVDREMRIYRRATRGDYVAFAAPGVGLRTAGTGSGGAVRSGTSFAVPFVTAAAANLLARDPGLDEVAISRSLSAAARDLGAPGRDPVYGWGLLQTAGLCDWRPPAPMPAIASDTTPSFGSSRKGRE